MTAPRLHPRPADRHARSPATPAGLGRPRRCRNPHATPATDFRRVLGKVGNGAGALPLAAPKTLAPPKPLASPKPLSGQAGLPPPGSAVSLPGRPTPAAVEPTPTEDGTQRLAVDPDEGAALPEPDPPLVVVLDDPLARALALPVAPVAPPAPSAPAALPVPEAVLEQLVQRFSWGGDRRRGTARLELASGRLAGAVVEVSADGGRVELRIEGAPPEELPRLEARLRQRLARRGLELAAFEG